MNLAFVAAGSRMWIQIQRGGGGAGGREGQRKKALLIKLLNAIKRIPPSRTHLTLTASQRRCLPIPSRWRLGHEHVIESWVLRKWLVKYGNRPLSGKGREVGISGCSVCAGPGGREWLRRVPCCLWFYGTSACKPCWPVEPQVTERRTLWEAATKAGVPDVGTSSCQRFTGDLEWARGRIGRCCPLASQSPEGIAVSPKGAELEA